MKLLKMLLCSALLLSAMSPVGFSEKSNLSDMVDNFSWKYFNTLDKNQNIFYSPYSITTALSVVANGSEGQTLEEMLNVLFFDSLEELNTSYESFSKSLKENYNEDGRIFLESNLILLNKNYAVKGINENYNKIVKDVYDSTVREADFTNNIEAEKQFIAKWVSEKTNKFIPNYNSVATPSTVMDILNVVYFKGAWAMPFKNHLTSKESFINKDASKIDVDMMKQSFKNEIKYYENGKYKAICLPYKTDDYGMIVTAMYLVLPVNDNDLDIADKWNKETLEYKKNFLHNIKNAPTFNGRVYVNLPKFDLDVENDLVENLKSIGIKRAFTNEAEFFNMVNDSSMKIDNVNHRAKVKVDEAGTEAAAVTEVIMVEGTAAGIPEPEFVKYFYANRPFLFVISDVDSEVELFTGVVNKM